MSIFLLLFLEFFKIGLFTFGGGYAMIPLVEETVLAHGWLTESEFFDFIGVCESTPGPIAVNMATYVGGTQGRLFGGFFGGMFGSICATLGVVLPSFIIILLIASLLKNLIKNKYFNGFLTGVKPIIIALILSTGVMLLIKTLGYVGLQEFKADVVSLIVFPLICGIYFAALKIFKKKLSAIQLILIAAALGLGVSMLYQWLI